MNIKYLILMCLVVGLVGCRGWKTDKPPVHPNINFDFQPKIKAQRDPLPLPANVVTFQNDRQKTRLSEYSIDRAFLLDGQKNYNIYCSACHTKAGNGSKSVVSQNGWVVSNILDDVTYERSDDAIYDIIDHGIRSMPGYGKKLSSKEIWQVVLYVRALQTMTRVANEEMRMLNRGPKK